MSNCKIWSKSKFRIAYIKQSLVNSASQVKINFVCQETCPGLLDEVLLTTIGISINDPI